MNGPGRPRDPQTGTAILDAARALLDEVGYSQLSMQAIARRAGVGKTTVYRRWSSKGLLVFDAFFTPDATLPVPDRGSLERDLEAIVRRVAQELDNPRLRAAIPGLLSDFFSDEALAARIREDLIFASRDRLSAIFQRALDRGELRFAPKTHAALAASIGGLVLRALLSGLPLDDTFVSELLDIVLNGLHRQPQP